MNLLGAVIFVSIFMNELNTSSTTLEVHHPNKSHRVDNFWTATNSTNHGTSRRSFRRSSDNSNSTLLSEDSRQNNNLKRIPQVNFYSSIPNALGVVGQGIIWLREISAALGTPLPIWIFTIPFFILGVGLMFMPDLTQLHLPLFYPDGAGDADPLSAFPPIFNLEDLSGLNIIKQATQLMPPKFIMEKWG